MQTVYFYMNKCSLCLINDADKTGSHTVPHFLVKKVDNYNGQKERDKEMGFMINDQEINSYAGRSLLPEQIEETIGQESKNVSFKVPHVVDHFICTDCEKYFSDIESEYSYIESLNSSIDVVTASAFWAGVVWRASASKVHGFRLSAKFEKSLRREVLKFKNDRDYLIERFEYVVLKSALENGHKNPLVLSFLSALKLPNAALIGPYALIFSPKQVHLDPSKFSFYGLEKLFTLNEISKKIETGKAPIFAVSDQEFRIALIQFWKIKGQTFKLNIISRLHNVYRSLGGKGKYMPRELIEQIFKELETLPVKDTMRYGTENVRQAVFNVLKRYVI